MNSPSLPLPLVLLLLALPAAADARPPARPDAQTVFAVGDGPERISFRKEPQGGGLGLSAFTVDAAGNVLCLDREGGKILVAGPDGKAKPPVVLPERVVFNDLFPARDGSGVWLVANPPALYRVALDGKVLEKRALAHHTSASSVSESTTGLLLVHDTAKNVAVVWKGEELRAALGGFFKPNLCLTGDSRLLQPGEESKKGIDLLLHDPYKARPDEKFATFAPGVKTGELLGVQVVGIDAQKRVVVATVELAGALRHLAFHRFSPDGKFLDRRVVREERRCPVSLTRDFVLGPEGAVYTTGSNDEESRFIVYRYDLGGKNR